MYALRQLTLGLTLLVAACGGNEAKESAEANDAAAGDNVLDGAALNEAEASALADEAAADEAADMHVYGGNAAAGETGNRF